MLLGKNMGKYQYVCQISRITIWKIETNSGGLAGLTQMISVNLSIVNNHKIKGEQKFENERLENIHQAMLLKRKQV